MPNITLITGGARSGKSSFALHLAEKIQGKRVFIATAVALDDEMKERIQKHKRERADNYLTIEEPIELEMTLGRISEDIDITIVDCLTVWLGNLFHKLQDNDKELKKEVERFIEFLACSSKCDIIFVTNEVGSGIIPENRATRTYRDIAGYLNTLVAKIADSVYLCVCGVSQKIK